ncbi:PREDICTED: putative receptor protein kinase ZmPK1 [Tarenaya hassleriana]|uniref:putative receptor protein kinase ZmPK1 n=1 Tax=Tarenaya hassleriana TaxID=28532 RepID=UPI00053C4537|nr:PREDICTED: putative receptor protein kinase ZmPK1 [Tarenaya hassleriana]
MKDLGEADVILGIRIIRDHGTISLSQSHYIEKVLKRFDLYDSTLVSTPMDCNVKLVANKGEPTINYGLRYTGQPSVLEEYTDASWNSSEEDHASMLRSESSRGKHLGMQRKEGIWTHGRYSVKEYKKLFLTYVKVWSSGHYSKLYVFDKCVLELTKDGDLRLKGRKKHVGWRTGTAGQGVEKLQLLSTGNLVLVDEMGLIKWQSFNFPTDVMLQGQRLDVATQLTSFPRDSNMFYTFEVLRDKIALFVNSGQVKYSYWEYKPAKNQNVNFIRLGLEGLDLFDDNSHKIARIEPERTERTQLLRFLAVGNRTGNLGLYSYSSEKGKFETSFQALNGTCDLPLACKPYGICTFSKACSCIKIATEEENSMGSDCGEEISGEKRRSLCDHEMLELDGVKTVLKNGTRVDNVSKEACEEMCKKDCKCTAAMYSEEGCFIYGIVMGVKQISIRLLNRQNLKHEE